MSRTYTIDRGGLHLALTDDGFVREARVHGKSLLSAPQPLFMLSIGTWGAMEPSDFSLDEVIEQIDGDRRLLSMTFSHTAHPVTVRAALMAHGPRVEFSLSMAIDWPDAPMQSFLRAPFLSEMSLPGARFRYPGNNRKKPDGSESLMRHRAFPLPLCLYDGDGAGLSMEFDIAWPGLTWDQNRNMDVNQIANAAQWREHSLRLRVDRHMALVLEADLCPLTGSWDEAFRLWRDKNRARMDLSQYARPDLQWVWQKQFHHFTYVYGREACQGDYTQFNLDALLKDGEAFGGYDAILIWHQYPRLGLDARSQWDFYDDFPGGQQGLKEISQAAHDRGVKVFLPFKPWDAGLDETPRDAIHRMARVVIDCEIDGIFFDTMNSVPEGLRELIDAERPSVAFCTEGRPDNAYCLESITCSWDQYWSENPMPEADALRFLLPEHASPLIARWHIDDRKDLLIQRAVFGGTGIVIWQDIFGAWLPYSDAQKAMIARWKRLFHQFIDLYRSPDALPMVDTTSEALYANLFPGADSAIVTLMNAGQTAVSGPLISAYGYGKVQELWADAEARVEGGMVFGDIGPGQVWVLRLLQSRESL